MSTMSDESVMIFQECDLYLSIRCDDVEYVKCTRCVGSGSENDMVIEFSSCYTMTVRTTMEPNVLQETLSKEIFHFVDACRVRMDQTPENTQEEEHCCQPEESMTRSPMLWCESWIGTFVLFGMMVPLGLTLWYR